MKICELCAQYIPVSDTHAHTLTCIHAHIHIMYACTRTYILCMHARAHLHAQSVITNPLKIVISPSLPASGLHSHIWTIKLGSASWEMSHTSGCIAYFLVKFRDWTRFPQTAANTEQDRTCFSRIIKYQDGCTLRGARRTWICRVCVNLYTAMHGWDFSNSSFEGFCEWKDSTYFC